MRVVVYWYMLLVRYWYANEHWHAWTIADLV
jgi:hypothetical protein